VRPGNAVDELAAVPANANFLAHGAQAFREGSFDYLGLTSTVARLALTRALAALVPGFPGLWLDRADRAGRADPAGNERREHPPSKDEGNERRGLSMGGGAVSPISSGSSLRSCGRTTRPPAERGCRSLWPSAA
jgi:hypothetical protein